MPHGAANVLSVYSYCILNTVIVAWLKVFGHLQPNSLGCSHYTMVSDWCVACDEDAHYAYTGQYHDITRTELPNNSYADSLKLRRGL